MLKKIAKWVLWYLIILLVLKVTDHISAFSAVHYLGLFAAVAVIDTIYSKRRSITKPEDDE